MQAAVSSLERIDDFVDRLSSVEEGKDCNKIKPLIQEAENKFKAAIGEDLNISPALAALFDLIRPVNALIDKNEIGNKEVEAVFAFLRQMDEVLGIIFFGKEETEISIELLELLKKREEARSKKDWKLADECRDLLLEQGYLIEDTPKGAKLKKK
jgi:cysteinyl-tRNA synthetase